MYLIVGLGNPEAEYARTRHNMGVDVVNELADKYKIAISREKFDGLYGTGEIENEKVILLKPQTYMNLSGDSVIQFANFYKLNPEEIIVIYDDIDTNPGKIRIRKKGGPGTHNGMKSVVSRLNSEDFPRVRVGIGMPEFKGDLVNYVIGNITDEDYEELKKGIRNALVCITERSDEFSKLDAVLGDGDHGTAIVQSMSALVATADKGTEFKSMLNDMSFNLMLEISGSTSTLLGGFFLGMSDHAEGTELDVAGVKAMFAGGLEGVRKQTKAKQGDKTMMDALIPAVEAIQTCDSADVKAILTAGAEAAVKGAEATKDMKANFGRARNYGERSIGYADSGASSWSCMFDAFAKAL